MKLPSGPKVHLPEVDSTQLEVKRRLAAGDSVGIVSAGIQTAGKGRFDRVWLSGQGDSLTVSMCLDGYKNHPKPYLIGMAMAIAVADTFDISLQWPNDLTLDTLKVGGILTEICSVGEDLIPVVGVGINLSQTEIPTSISHRATSLVIAGRRRWSQEEALVALLNTLEQMPDPNNWQNLAPLWMKRDQTPGKMFRTKVGDSDETHLVIARGIGDDGALQAEYEGKPVTVYAADALFGV